MGFFEPPGVPRGGAIAGWRGRERGRGRRRGGRAGGAGAGASREVLQVGAAAAGRGYGYPPILEYVSSSGARLHEIVRLELVEDAALFNAHGGDGAARGERHDAAVQVECGLAAGHADLRPRPAPRALTLVALEAE